jgi:protein-tyrosine sulfotransferase
MSDLEDRRPVFVLCAARSGSTLLRQVLDAHPGIACPPELNLAVAFDAIWFASHHAVAHDDEAAQVITAAICRHLAERTAGAYAHRRGKRRWCEKSLPSLDHAELLVRLFPEAQFICLYRECTDTIASANEACPWGYQGYGFEPYVRSSLGNLALAFAHYWADNADVLTGFEAKHQELCQRVRYEDMVGKPQETLSALFNFLDLPWHDAYLDPGRIFAESATGDPGDYKIRYTRGFETASVGRGWAVPIDLIPSALQQRINRLHAELGYPRLDADVRDSLTFQLDGGRQSPRQVGTGLGRQRQGSIGDLFHKRVARRLASKAAWDAPRGISAAIRIVLADQLDPWIIDLAAGRVCQGEGEAGCTVLTDAETLLGIGDGSRNPALELRRSKLRIACDRPQPGEAFWKHLDMLTALLGPDAGEDPEAEGEPAEASVMQHGGEAIPDTTRGW